MTSETRIYVLYDGRACVGEDADNAVVLAVCRTRESAARESKLYSDSVFCSFREEGAVLVDKRFEWQGRPVPRSDIEVPQAEKSSAVRGKLIPNVPEFVEAMSVAFPECEFRLEKQGMDGRSRRPWYRAFMVWRATPVSIGRVNFRPCRGGWTVYGVARYGRWESDKKIPNDPGDGYFDRLDAWLKAGGYTL